MNVNHPFNAPSSSNSALPDFVTCAKCGASNPSVSEFCRQCGDPSVTPAAATRARSRPSPVLVALGSCVITAIPLVALLLISLNRAGHARDEARVAASRAQESLAAKHRARSGPDVKPDERSFAGPAREYERTLRNHEQNIAALREERDRFRAEAQASARRIKTAEDKYEETDRLLRNAEAHARELQEELDARNAQQARTMQKLTETESRLRSAEARNQPPGNDRP